jgi:DNA repair exonuclease SbcCD ATPase subunit
VISEKDKIQQEIEESSKEREQSEPSITFSRTEIMESNEGEEKLEDHQLSGQQMEKLSKSSVEGKRRSFVVDKSVESQANKRDQPALESRIAKLETTIALLANQNDLLKYKMEEEKKQSEEKYKELKNQSEENLKELKSWSESKIKDLEKENEELRNQIQGLQGPSKKSSVKDTMIKK